MLAAGRRICRQSLSWKKARTQLHKRFSTKRRLMRIKTIGAEGIRAADNDGLSDPYVHIGVVSGSNSDMQIFRHECKPRKKTLTPVWNDYVLVPGDRLDEAVDRLGEAGFAPFA